MQSAIACAAPWIYKALLRCCSTRAPVLYQVLLASRAVALTEPPAARPKSGQLDHFSPTLSSGTTRSTRVWRGAGFSFLMSSCVAEATPCTWTTRPRTAGLGSIVSTLSCGGATLVRGPPPPAPTTSRSPSSRGAAEGCQGASSRLPALLKKHGNSAPETKGRACGGCGALGDPCGEGAVQPLRCSICASTFPMRWVCFKAFGVARPGCAGGQFRGQ